jgi:FtsH-binding integral membrane protein
MNANYDPQDLWKSSDPALPQPPATTGICALARRRERENVWQRIIGLFALAGFAIAFAHNTWEVDQPWVRLGQGWMLIVMLVYLWSLIRDRTSRRASNETCAGFLLRSLKRKRDGFLAVRRAVLFIIPAVFASWWGGGAALKARAMGLDPASLYYLYLTSVWPMVATCFLLLVIWFAFSGAAKKASTEFDALRDRIAAT